MSSPKPLRDALKARVELIQDRKDEITRLNTNIKDLQERLEFRQSGILKYEHIPTLQWCINQQNLFLDFHKKDLKAINKELSSLLG